MYPFITSTLFHKVVEPPQVNQAECDLRRPSRFFWRNKSILGLHRYIYKY